MLLFTIFLALFFSALFSGTEIAFISASKLKVELRKQQGSRMGKTLASFYEKPADFLSTMLVGNNIALVIFTILMEKLMRDSIGAYISGEVWALLVMTIFTTIIVLIFGEFLPKTIFRLFSNDILYYLSYPLAGIKWLLTIPAWIMTRLSNIILRFLFKTPIEKTDNVITRLDLENFIRDTKIKDSAEEIDTEIFEKALHLKNVKVKECMVPRTEIEDIDLYSNVEELKEIFVSTKLSRLIVTKEGIDNVLGYVHHHQLLQNPSSVRKLILEIPFVPESMRVQDLMNKFIKQSVNIACVVDEYGGTAGIITLEDILEEIFGEIEDEHDQEDYLEKQLSDTEFLFSGRLEINYLNEKYDILHFPEGEYTTLSGYLVMTTGEIQENGAEIELDGYKFILEIVSDTKIETVRVIKLDLANEEMD